MGLLDKNLRNKLERTIQEAREIAEKAAEGILSYYGVFEPVVPLHLTADKIELREKLRIHARQLGDPEAGTETQENTLLKEEIAYEHWHRMLFARFLAENRLLMDDDPDTPVSVTLVECIELALEYQLNSGWELAAKFASRMLPQIFRNDSPVFQIVLPTEHRNKLEQLVESLPIDVFIASDSLGWVYQFWQSRKKDQINQSEVKIGARELPAVTQLFTEPYMVQFLLDNALGAWWASRRLSAADFEQTANEAELRQKASIPGVSLTYLRFTRNEAGKWRPIGGAFKEWPEHLSQLKILDPCCGSGHFLVAALYMLVPMRMELENLTAAQAVDAVLSQNLHGLELDRRCVELAAFALAFAAWRFPGSGSFRNLPQLNLACSGLSVSVSKDYWKKFAGDQKNFEIALGWLHDEFKNAPLLGSLLDPGKSLSALLVEKEKLFSMLSRTLGNESNAEQYEIGVVAQGLALAARLMMEKYHWVITNVPYLTRNKQDSALKEYSEKHYKEAKYDLATIFLDRCLEFCRKEGGNVSVVLPQNWLFLTSYRPFREKLLKQNAWQFIVRLGPQAFQTPMWDLNIQLLNINRGNTWANADDLFKKDQIISHLMYGLDVSSLRTAKEKDEYMVITDIKPIEQMKQLGNPDSIILLHEIYEKTLLGEYATINYGSKPGQTERIIKYQWEIPLLSQNWQYLESTPSGSEPYTGKEKLCLSLTEIRKQGIKEFGIRSADIWGKKGIVVSQMNEMFFSLYLGYLFDNNTSVIWPKKKNYLPGIFAFLDSREYLTEIRKINQKLDVAAHTMVKVPFDLEKWQKVAAEKYPNGLPKPYSDDPTQWIFHGHPAQSEHPLQVAVARLLGYQWPAEQDEKMELSEKARQWVAKCRELHSFADKDGIVCLPPVRGELSAADRLLSLLAAAYGSQWNNSLLNRLLRNANHEGKDLETWLKEKFFIQHCTLFHHRPFIWHIWDGLRDGFSALVNYHKLDGKNLETLIYYYLGDWLKRRKDDVDHNIDGAEEKLKAAETLKKKLKLILIGENPYDIFVRWKPLEKQPIGWNPDLNDGVRLNIRPFMTAPDLGKKGAGVLKDRPNIDWKKDRGKDVETAPWYHLFKGNRENNHHLSLEEKKQVKEN